MKVSKFLELRKESHEELGDIFVLYSPVDLEGRSAYYIQVEDAKGKKDDGTVEDFEVEVGMGLRLTKASAAKLAWQLLKEIGEAPCEDLA